MGDQQRPLTGWTKSSYSLNEDSYCVETAGFPGLSVGVRDSKRPDGPVVRFSGPAWAGFIAWTANGAFAG